MNTEGLYLGEIRRAETRNKTTHIEYTILKKIQDEKYMDVLSMLRKSYKTYYDNEGELYINTDSDYLIPYEEALPRAQMKTNKSRKELKEDLIRLKQELEIDVSNVFIGHIAQAISISYTSGVGDTPLQRFLTTGWSTQYIPIKRTIFQKVDIDKYMDLETGKIYSRLAYSKGDLFVPDKLYDEIYPLNQYLSNQEKCTRMPKRKILRRFKELNKESDKNEK